MNRRQFTQSLAALISAPAIPAAALAKTATTTPLHMFQHPYSWAAFTARIHDKASPAMFKRQLALTDEMAQHVYDVLLKENVITMPDALGVSKTLKPFGRSAERVANLYSQNTDQASLKSNLRERAEKMLNDDEAGEIESNDSNSVNHQVTQSEHERTIPQNTTQPHAEIREGSDQLAAPDPIAPGGARDIHPSVE
ncbi:hypothetical protein GCM10008927_17380 [Amylibacter ulvae]|uniref:Uncharacterized protein n=1 Tax=Paramylibacter ulvae TaxID=1651968 RepID=A0ABQ3D0E3_9RHOB|nr:hypothetical protein [Amylibacter ulvae]GHA52448.1 hypothetical protein GCM10008927_17380 [Amylibacter ulvae]